jgi:hypothetical protein
MKDLFKQRVITIGIDKSTSKPHVVTRFIYVPVYYQEAEREAVRESMLPISTSDGLLLARTRYYTKHENRGRRAEL